MHSLKQLSEVSSSRKTTDNEIEDFYFDDVIRPDMLKDKHMRLQSTMALDYSGSAMDWTPARQGALIRPGDRAPARSDSSSSGTPVYEPKITYVKVKRDRTFPQGR